MFRYLFVIGLLLVFLTACVPATPDATVPQAEDAAETSATVQDAGDDHSDEDVDDHEEDAVDHGGEEGEHSDEDADGHEEDTHHDEDSDAHEHEGENEQREHGAHEHGAAQLMIAWSGNQMVIDLETPSYNVLGFEYAPTSEAEKDLLAESVTALEEGDLLQINPEAECTIVSANVQSTLLEEESHDEEADEDDHEGETHSDIDVAYSLECQQPDNIEALDASQLFAKFPNFQAIQVQWISDTQQSAADLTPDNPVLSFK